MKVKKSAEQIAYESYVKYCKSIGTEPSTFEDWSGNQPKKTIRNPANDYPSQEFLYGHPFGQPAYRRMK